MKSPKSSRKHARVIKSTPKLTFILKNYLPHDKLSNDSFRQISSAALSSIFADRNTPSRPQSFQGVLFQSSASKTATSTDKITRVTPEDRRVVLIPYKSVLRSMCPSLLPITEYQPSTITGKEKKNSFKEVNRLVIVANISTPTSSPREKELPAQKFHDHNSFTEVHARLLLSKRRNFSVPDGK